MDRLVCSKNTNRKLQPHVNSNYTIFFHSFFLLFLLNFEILYGTIEFCKKPWLVFAYLPNIQIILVISLVIAICFCFCVSCLVSCCCCCSMSLSYLTIEFCKVLPMIRNDCTQIYRCTGILLYWTQPIE